MKITSEAITSKKRKIRITTFYYKNKNLYYDAQIYTLILEDPDDTAKRLFYTVADIYPRDRRALEQFDLIVAKDKVSLETHYRILSSIIGRNQPNEEELDQIIKPLSSELEIFSKMIGKYVDLHQVGNHMALVGDQSIFTCIESLLSLGDCLLTTSEAIDLCPLCAQVVTCIPACVDIFTAPVCLACEATGLGGCIVCLIAAYVCYDAALAVRNNCL